MKSGLGARWVLLAGLCLAGCVAETQEEDVAANEEGILGGIPAKSEKYDAVGVLYGVRPVGAAPICTGTLIGPHTVLTAGHCVRPKGAALSILERFPVYFTIGYDAAAPAQTIRAVWSGKTPVAEQDIGIYQLEHAPDGVSPMEMVDTFLGEEDIGEKLTVVGFGLQDADDTFLDFLTRRAGRMRLTTFDPQPLHVLFPEFAAFKAFMEDNAGHTFTDAQALAIYDHQLLQPGDAFVGSPSEPQVVYLDSGGPNLQAGDDGVLRIRGVNARGYRSDPTVAPTTKAQDLMPVGSAIAMLGHPDTMSFIDQSLTDPCRNISPGGHCSATLAVRCGTELDPPVISLLDCAEIGAVCKVDADGLAGCDDP